MSKQINLCFLEQKLLILLIVLRNIFLFLLPILTSYKKKNALSKFQFEHFIILLRQENTGEIKAVWPYLHVFSEGTGVCVGLVAHFAEIGLVRRVDVHVFLAITAVCKPPVAAIKLTLKRLLT